MVAPSQRALGAVISGSTGAPSFPAPVGVTATDLIVVGAFVDVASTTVTAVPTGFTVVPNTPQVANHSLRVYYGRFSDVGAGPYTFTLSATVFVEGRTVAIQDATITGSPWDATSGATSGTINQNTAPFVTATSTGTNRYAFYMATNWSGGNWTPPTGFTNQWNANTKVITFDDMTLPTAQTVSPQATCATSDKETAWVGIVLPVTAPPPVGGQGAGVMGWDLYATLVNQSEYKLYYDSTLPVACPYDGTPLREGPSTRPGVLYCPNGDFRYPEDWDSDTMSGM